MCDWPNKTFANKDVAVAAGKKGGAVKSDKKRLARIIRCAKEFGIKDKLTEKVLYLIDSKELTAIDWFKHIDILEKMAEQNPKLNFALIDAKKDWAKFIHGEKRVNENLNINVNWTEVFQGCEVKDDESGKDSSSSRKK